jgi:hypothetical protein
VFDLPGVWRCERWVLMSPTEVVRRYRPLLLINGNVGDDLCVLVMSQLPRVLQDQLQVEISSDPYHLKTTARFGDQKGREFKTELERNERGIACVVPENFIAHLCAVL